MNITAPDTAPSRGSSQVFRSTTGTVLLAIALGLCGGYLDLVVMTFMKYWWNDLRYFWSGRDFPWSVPVGHALFLAVVGVLAAVVNRALPGRMITLRSGAWLFTTLAIWGALLRLPLYGICTLILAVGLGRPISTAVAASSQKPRAARYALAGLFVLLILLAALSTGRQAVRKNRALSALPMPAPGARNVVLIVWDAVRAPSLSLYGYDRDNTPNLRKWAAKGACYMMGVAPAPWTYPSHSCMFTGQWPYQLNTQWNSSLDTACPTLAEYLTSRGYQTAAFVANTRCCSYETGLDRGFADYDDYPLTPEFFLGRTFPGSWILQMSVLWFGDFYASKWITVQSRDARGINGAFLDWLGRRRRDRPFFAFLNYFDAHNPYIPPAEYAGRFGIRPEFPDDYVLLMNYRQQPIDPNWERTVAMARDCYDDCIASLDDQLGRLLNALRRQGLLDNTMVIITSDHGESFGDHELLIHGTGVYIDQIAVPLVILSPDAPAGLSVSTPVSLRDLPATIVDRLGLSAGSPFPGHSLAEFWSSKSGQPPPEISPGLAELVGSGHTFEHQDKPGRQAFQMSLLAPGWHYIRDGTGAEQLYDLGRDMGEFDNLAGSAPGTQPLGASRRTLLDELTGNPGSTEAENAYLKSYRQRLKSLVGASSPPSEPVAAVGPR